MTNVQRSIRAWLAGSRDRQVLMTLQYVGYIVWEPKAWKKSFEGSWVVTPEGRARFAGFDHPNSRPSAPAST